MPTICNLYDTGYVLPQSLLIVLLVGRAKLLSPHHSYSDMPLSFPTLSFLPVHLGNYQPRGLGRLEPARRQVRAPLPRPAQPRGSTIQDVQVWDDQDWNYGSDDYLRVWFFVSRCCDILDFGFALHESGANRFIYTFGWTCPFSRYPDTRSMEY